MATKKPANTFFGRKVVDYDPSKPLKVGTAPRLSLWSSTKSRDMDAIDLLIALRKDPNASKIEALVIGHCSDSLEEEPNELIKELTSAANRKAFTSLAAVFLYDIEPDEQEISWIHVGNPGKILDAYPALRCLRVRGTEDFQFKCKPHHALTSLTIESGGLPKAVVKGVINAGFASLERLELWLGSEDYGADHRIDDLMPILSGRVFPRLKHLGLRNCEYTDEIATALADAPILKQIESLDLSMGTLGDAGAAALLASPLFARLSEVDLSHHFLSDAVAKKLAKTVAKLTATRARGYDANDADDRYIEVSE